jgi:hypothetical protein
MFASRCKDRFTALAGSEGANEAPTGLPSALEAGPFFLREGRTTRLVCKLIGPRALLIAISGPEARSDLSPFAPLLEAIVRAAEALPAPDEATPPAPPQPVVPSHHGRLGDGALAWFELEAPVSWRVATVASDGKAAPSPRVTFPSLNLGVLASAEWGLLVRMSLALGIDLVEAAGGGEAPTTSPRYGGQRWEVLLDFGYAVNVGDWGRLGLTLGWHGLSGPLTKNSSLAASLYGVVAPEPDTFAFMLRVTPMQLVAANERDFLSPLTIESRFIYGPVSLGIEGQWIDAPRPGDEDIPSRGFALLFRLGYGQSSD